LAAIEGVHNYKYPNRSDKIKHACLGYFQIYSETNQRFSENNLIYRLRWEGMQK